MQQECWVRTSNLNHWKSELSRYNMDLFDMTKIKYDWFLHGFKFVTFRPNSLLAIFTQIYVSYGIFQLFSFPIQCHTMPPVLSNLQPPPPPQYEPTPLPYDKRCIQGYMPVHAICRWLGGGGWRMGWEVQRRLVKYCPGYCEPSKKIWYSRGWIKLPMAGHGEFWETCDCRRKPYRGMVSLTLDDRDGTKSHS